MFGIDQLRHHLDAQLTQILTKVENLERMVNTIPTDQDLQAALSAFSGAVSQAVADANTRVETHIDALKAQIANGQPVTQADLDAVLATQTQAVADITGIDPANPTPPPTP